jgi:hypothetical protein
METVMENESKPTYEELEKALWRHERWSWKRSLIAVGFGSIIPALLAVIFLVRPHHDTASSKIGYAKALAFEGVRGVPATVVRDQDEALAIVEKETREHAARAKMDQDAAQARSIRGDAEKEPPSPKTSDAVPGLLAITAFGLGLLAFRKRDLHAGYGLTAAAGVIAGVVLTVKSVDAGSFMAFDAFLSLKIVDLVAIPVGHLGLIVLASVSGVFGLFQIPNLLHAALTLVGSILGGIGRGIGHAAGSYGSFCWFLACKVVH